MGRLLARRGAIKRRSTPTGRAILKPVGFTPLSDAAAAALVRKHGWEPRASNQTANNRIPTSPELSSFQTAIGTQLSSSVKTLVTGNHSMAGSSGTSYSTTVLADSPIVYARLEETTGSTLADSSGSGLAITSESPISTLAALPNVTGPITGLTANNAKSFDGNSRVLVATSTALDIWSGAWTVEMWFKRSATQGANQTLLRRGSGIQIYFNASNKLRVVNSNVSTDVAESSSAITDTASWHHLAVTRASGGEPIIYLDGTAVTSPLVTGTTWGNGSSFASFGASASSTHFVGSIDEIALYNTALSSTRVNAHITAATASSSAGPSTDELIQWAAYKWGLDEDLMRAEGVQESSWFQSAAGDNNVDGSPASWGLMQIKGTNTDGTNPFNWNGTYPLSSVSTAFNLDFYGAVIRDCFEGRDTYLGNGYQAGDIDGCLGFWFSGNWKTTSANSYTASVRAHYNAKDWETYPGYAGQNA